MVYVKNASTGLVLLCLVIRCGLLTEPIVAQSACYEKLPARGSNFGAQVAVDGETLLVESMGTSAFVYHREEGAWVLEATIPRPRANAGPGVGPASLSGDRILLGGRNSIPTIWHRAETRWVREASLTPTGGGRTQSYGQYYALDGDSAVVTDHDRGRAYFFRREGAEWAEENVVERGSLFGWTVDLDGDVAVVGDYGETPGRAVVLRRTEVGASGRWEVEDELVPSRGCPMVGADVAVCGDLIIVGSAPDFARPDQPCGAFIFRYDPAAQVWIEEQHIEPEGVVPSDRFGSSVAIDGTVVAIGAMGDSRFEGASGFGTLYVYSHDGTEWVEAARLSPTDQRQNDWFARSASVSGKTVVVGARNAAGGVGAAYSFTFGLEAAFTIIPEAPAVGEEVTFDASSSSSQAGVEIATFDWSFEEGRQAEGAVVRRVFDEPGRFPVSLVARDDEGGCGSATGLVTAGCPPGDLAPWTSGAVGLQALPGAGHFEGDGEFRELVLCAGGDNIQIGSRPDDFYFVHREVVGDVVLTARLDEFSDTPRARVGVMLRESLEVGARHAAMLFENSSLGTSRRFRFVHREQLDGRGRGQSGVTSDPPDVWVRLRREGNEFIGLTSLDGENWTEVHRVTLELPEVILAGVAASGGDGDPNAAYRPLGARLSNIELKDRSAPDEPTFRRGDANSDGSVDVADGVTVLDFLFEGLRVLPCTRSADADDSGGIDVSDVIFLFNFLFSGGPGLPPPGVECGADPTPDELACDREEPCA